MATAARSALAEWLGLGGVTIVRVDELPVAPVRGQPFLGERTTLAAARRRVEFAIALPHGEGSRAPDEVYVRDFPPDGAACSSGFRRAAAARAHPVARPDDRARADQERGPGTVVERVRVGPSPGAWIGGAPHTVYSAGRDGDEYEESLWLAGNVLVWELGGRALRIEADIPKDEALRLARDTR